MNTPSHFFLSENNLPFKDYLKFGLSVDCVVFGYNEGKVQVLLIERNAEPFKGSWALPGELVPMNANLEDSANDVLMFESYKTHIKSEKLLIFCILTKIVNTFGETY